MLHKLGHNNPKLKLVVASFLMLFLELAIIRWSGSNVIYLSYFTNFILLGSFLGIGIGFLRAKSSISMFRLAPLALIAYIVFVHLFPVTIVGSTSQLIYFGNFGQTGLPEWVTLPVIFLMVAFVMETVAEDVARRFREFGSLDAYRLDIIGSISGIVVFSILSCLLLYFIPHRIPQYNLYPVL